MAANVDLSAPDLAMASKVQALHHRLPDTDCTLSLSNAIVKWDCEFALVVKMDFEAQNVNGKATEQ